MNQSIALTLFFVMLLPLTVQAQSLTSTPGKPDGVYGLNEKISWTLKGPDDLKQVTYVIKRGGLVVIDSGTLDLTHSPAVIQTSLDQPGTVLVEVSRSKDDKAPHRLGAAAVPDQIKPSTPRPDDFDAFWAGKLADLAKVPVNPQIEAADSGSPRVEYFKVRLDNVNGTHVYGQLARPAKPGKYPAVVQFQSAGVVGLKKEMVIPLAEQGFLVLHIMPHDLPFDRDDDFYKAAGGTTLKGYGSIGKHDRDKSYFVGMYLGCCRALDYVQSRDDWDGKTLIVMGTSMGGQQAFAAAGLCPKVSAMMVKIPAGCDATGPLVERASGYPYWRWWDEKPDTVAMNVGRYFDGVNFAKNIKCPALVACGLIDTTCPAAGVMAAFNQLPGQKELIVMPLAAHQESAGSQQQYDKRSRQWLDVIRGGQSLPPP